MEPEKKLCGTGEEISEASEEIMRKHIKDCQIGNCFDFESTFSNNICAAL